jgi:transcriptional regulator with XRE-family HTH domain
MAKKAEVFNSLGTIIRYKRKQRKMTQVQLAKKLGVSVNSLYNWEGDTYYPSALCLCCLADFFECTVDELLGRTELT